MRSRFVIKAVSKELTSEWEGTYVRLDVQDVVTNKKYIINIGTINKKAVVNFKPYFDGLSNPDKHGNRFLITDKIVPEAIFEINYYIREKQPHVVQPIAVKFVGYTPDKQTIGVKLF